MRRFALAALSALTLVACSRDSTAPSAGVTGTYTLQKVQGVDLPYTFPGGTTLTAETATLNSNGSYTFISQYSNSPTSTERGSYSANGGSISFTPDAGTAYQGSVSGTVLTIISGGYSSVYQRQ